MSHSTTAASAQRAFKLTPQAVFAAWRTITREQVVTTFLLGCGMFIYRVVVTINIGMAPFIFIADQLKAFALLLAIVVADHVTGKNPDRRGPYVLAVVVSTAVAVPITIIIIATVVSHVFGPEVRPPGGIGFALNIYFEFLMVGGAAIWIINDRRRAEQARARMHEAELERIAAERQSIESDLQAMQARIEPQFLLNTLAQVKRSYARDSASGEKLLDALIAYLRTAMPKMRNISSNVKDELELVRAYLAIAKLRMGERLGFTIEPVSGQVAAARMPAMILLPLIDHAIDPLSEWHATSSFRARVYIAEEKIRVEILVTGADLVAKSEDDRIAAVRGRLAALYGDQAVLQVLQPGVDQTESVLVIPHEQDLRGVAARRRS
ncbi:MAG: histidine kinase [Casimicrobiaceae bacterium]